MPFLRKTILLFLPLLTAGLSAAPKTGFVNLRADLMRVPKSMVKSAPEKAIEHSDTRLTASVFLNVLSGTRAQVKLQDTFETREGGLSFAVTPDIHVPGKTARIDFTALYLMPDGGVFRAPGDSGFNNAAGISSRRILRVLRPAAVGLFAMPGEGAIVPLLYVYTQYPVPNLLTQFTELECRLLTIRSDELKRFAGNPLVEPLLRDYVLDRIAQEKSAFSRTLKISRGRAVYSDTVLREDPVRKRKVPVGVTIRFSHLSGAVFRFELTETRFIGERESSDPDCKGKVPVFETFAYEGYLAAQKDKWIMPARIVSCHAGTRSFFEEDKSDRPGEKIILIKMR